MRKLSRFEREALSDWRAETALYTQGSLTAAAREHLKILLERTLEVRRGPGPRGGEVLGAVLGDMPSATTVSRIARELDRRVQEFHHRPLEDRWPFLYLAPGQTPCARWG